MSKSRTLSKAEAAKNARLKSLVTHRSFRLSPRAKIDNSGLDSPWQILKSSYRLVADNYTKFVWLWLWYVPLIALFARDPVNQQIDSVIASNLVLVAGLASIWLIRHLDGGEEPTVRQAFYQGMTPLVPFLMLVMWFGIQMIFVGLGFALFQWSQLYGIAITQSETILAGVLAALISYPSLFWAPSTLMSFYVITLPGITPRDALKIGRKLVDGRRWFIYQRIIPLVGLIAAVLAGLYLLFIKLEWTKYLMDMFVIATVMAIPLVHVYLYKVYKSLL